MCDDTTTSTDLHAAYLLEYEKLKDEQCHRLTVRDNLIYATFTAIAAVVAFGFTGPDPRWVVLLLLPPVTIVLGWTYLSNDRKITEIGTYIRTELTVAIAGQRNTPVFGWEHNHRGPGVYRAYRKTTQAAVDLTVFVVTGIVAVVAFGVANPAYPNPAALFGLVSSVELTALLFLGWEILRNADIRRN